VNESSLLDWGLGIDQHSLLSFVAEELITMALPTWFGKLLGFASAATETTGEELALRFVEYATSKWERAKEQEANIEKAVSGRQVLGTADSLKRPSYASSPLLNYIKNRCTQNGVVYVAYAPSSCGKTTACFATMRKYASATPGIAFCGADIEGAYYSRLMNLLKLDYKNPPKGWMTRLLDALEVSRDGKHSYLLIDDFMLTGWNDVDQVFLTTLKAAIRGRNVVAILLTGNREAANKMLSYNELRGIRPLAEWDEMPEIRKTYEPIQRGVPLDFDWEKYVSMVWTDKALIDAALAGPRYWNKSVDEKAKLTVKISKFLDGSDPSTRANVTPMDVLAFLYSDNPLLQTETTSPTNATQSLQESNPFCHCGAACCIS
jgi:hypothetical protein